MPEPMFVCVHGIIYNGRLGAYRHPDTLQGEYAGRERVRTFENVDQAGYVADQLDETVIDGGIEGRRLGGGCGVSGNDGAGSLGCAVRAPARPVPPGSGPALPLHPPPVSSSRGRATLYVLSASRTGVCGSALITAQRVCAARAGPRKERTNQTQRVRSARSARAWSNSRRAVESLELQRPPGRPGDLTALADVLEHLQQPANRREAPHQSVELPHNDSVDRSVAEVLEQALVRGPPKPPARCTGVAVRVDPGAIYTRISLDRDSRSESWERQALDCRNAAEGRGWWYPPRPG
jgi:hypothetical protein